MSTQRPRQLLRAGHFRQNKRTNYKIKSCNHKRRMKPEEKKELTEHINAIAEILHRQAKPEQVKALAEIEKQLESKCSNI